MGTTHTGPERRTAQRFPIQLGLRYRVMLPGFLEPFGTGTTLNMSRAGILFAAEGRLTPRTPVEIVVEWPARAKQRLNLVISGRVVRVQQGPVPAIAIKIGRYEFVLVRADVGD